MEKQQEWQGYYGYYLSEARRKGINPLQVLDEQWFDGRTTAQCVLSHISTDSDVLEIACGIGRVSRFIAPHCRRLHCADILDEALAEAKLQLGEFHNISFEKINGYDLNVYESDLFDCVYSFTAFFHFDFELVVRYFAEIKRVLKQGGVAIIEFKQWKAKQDVIQLLDKIEQQGGLEIYHAELDKWRYVSKEMLAVLCDFYDLQVIDPDVTKFTFRKR
jgi:ubiquinone/menaquinone biosynthesis C-methylase UbiE